MENRDCRPPAGREPHHRSRRSFLKVSALAAAGAAAIPAVGAERRGDPRPGAAGRGNQMPGRIVLYYDSGMEAHTATINSERVELSIQRGIRILTGIEEVGPAFESLFPGVHAGSVFAIKVNCIGPCDTRWETVRGVVSGLSQMIGGTFNVSQVTIYDPHNLAAHGYTADRFTFGGNTAVISNSTNAGSYYVYGSHRLSQYLVNADYVINVPVPKSHYDANNQITATFKNHYGSCSPQSLCGNITGMLTVNADQHVKPKTGLIVVDALRATYNGGPGASPQVWNTFPDGTPNTLFFSTDPTTCEYWTRELINTERSTHGWSPKPCPWVEQSSGAPYNLGVSNPDDMVVINHDGSYSAVDDRGATVLGLTYLGPNVPNPVTAGTAVRFRLAAGGPAALDLVDASGRVVRRLARGRYPDGWSVVHWDGRDERGVAVPAGVYFTRLSAGRAVRTRRILVAR